jgi:hypothetical protein
MRPPGQHLSFVNTTYRCFNGNVNENRRQPLRAWLGRADPLKGLPTVVDTTELVGLEAARANGSFPDVAGGNIHAPSVIRALASHPLVNCKYPVFVKAEK